MFQKEKRKKPFHEKNNLRRYLKKINLSFKNFLFEKSKNLVVNALGYYFKHNKVIDKKYAWKKFTNIGKKFLYRDHYDFATSIFQAASTFHPEKKENESLFLILWSHLLRKDYRGAQNFILKENLIERFAKLNSKLRFWVALTLKKNGEKALAKSLYKEIISLNPLSFYSIISLKELNKSSKQNKEDQIISYDSPPLRKELKIKNFKPHFINSLRRLLVWIKLKNYNLELKEIETLISLEPNLVYKFPQKVGLKKTNHEKFLFIEIVKFLTNRGKYLRSFKLIQKSLTFKKLILNQQYLEILFPFEYFSQIKKIDDSIDPIIILSLIRQESAFNPKAISRVGARGLMQIMPTTAKTIKRQITRSQLKNPQLNLKIGIKYFKRLLNKYKGNLIYTLAAYNAGESRIATWKKKIFSSEDPLSIIESIPFKETRNYVKLIYRNIFFYKWLEKKSNLSVPLKDSFIISF
jgi:soluble lytic murein transglycosylase